MSTVEKLEELKTKIMDFVDETDPDEVFNGTVDEFYDQEENFCGLWIGAEPGPTKDTIPIWNYYGSEFPLYKESGTWDCLKSWEEFANANGIYHEWNDPGTIMIYFV